LDQYLIKIQKGVVNIFVKASDTISNCGHTMPKGIKETIYD